MQSVTDPRNLATMLTFLGLCILSLHALLQTSVNNWRIIVMVLCVCVCVCVRARARVCVHVHVCVYVCVHAIVIMTHHII